MLIMSCCIELCTPSGITFNFANPVFRQIGEFLMIHSDKCVDHIRMHLRFQNKNTQKKVVKFQLKKNCLTVPEFKISKQNICTESKCKEKMYILITWR